jgi:hypothetical protein
MPNVTMSPSAIRLPVGNTDAGTRPGNVNCCYHPATEPPPGNVNGCYHPGDDPAFDLHLSLTSTDEWLLAVVAVRSA